MSTGLLNCLPRVIGIVGSGQMGSGVAQLAAVKGLEVILSDNKKEALERGQHSILANLQRLIKKQKLTENEADLAYKRIKTVDSLQGLETADFVLEAVSENEDLKLAIFEKLDMITRPNAIMASNTSSISITRIASVTERPGQVVGMHFMNPVPVMALCELIRGMATTDEVFETSRSLAEHLGKTVCTSQDRPGFVVNRVLMPMINEAFYALMEGVATAEDIDKGMKLGTNVPMGPLTLADFIGLDTCLAIMRVLNEGMGDSKYRPCPLLVQYVDAGWLGKKTCKGVYNYAKPL